jgi:hypothetical protein
MLKYPSQRYPCNFALDYLEFVIKRPCLHPGIWLTLIAHVQKQKRPRYDAPSASKEGASSSSSSLSSSRIQKGIYKELSAELAQVASAQTSRLLADIGQSGGPSRSSQSTLRDLVENMLGTELSAGIYETRVENKVLQVGKNEAARPTRRKKRVQIVDLKGMRRANVARQKEVKTGACRKVAGGKDEEPREEYGGMVPLNALWEKHVRAVAGSKV